MPGAWRGPALALDRSHVTSFDPEVPVLKVRSQACGLRADVVFNQPDGIKSSEWVRDRLEAGTSDEQAFRERGAGLPCSGTVLARGLCANLCGHCALLAEPTYVQRVTEDLRRAKRGLAQSIVD